jgi:phosphohistidine phosphatase
MLERLTLIRHAKAIPGTLSQLDVQRSLTAHGAREAFNLGMELRAQELAPDVIICSMAARTRETLAHITGGYENPIAPVVYSEKLYQATAEELLEEAKAAGKKHVMLIGHNPAMVDLMMQLVQSTLSVPDGFVSGYFPTCMCVSFDMAAEEPKLDVLVATRQLQAA